MPATETAGADQNDVVADESCGQRMAVSEYHDLTPPPTHVLPQSPYCQLLTPLANGPQLARFIWGRACSARRRACRLPHPGHDRPAVASACSLLDMKCTRSPLPPPPAGTLALTHAVLQKAVPHPWSKVATCPAAAAAAGSCPGPGGALQCAWPVRVCGSPSPPPRGPRSFTPAHA